METDPIDVPLTEPQVYTLRIQSGQVFTPRTPISSRELFAGRWNEIQQLVDAVNEIGLHVVLYGERGVGKTSLANVIPIIFEVFDADLKPPRSAPRITVRSNATTSDTFSSIWEKVFDQISWTQDMPTMGFKPKPGVELITLRSAYGVVDRELTIEDVRRVLSGLPGSVFVIDEFDRLTRKHASQFADLIKALSDGAIETTIMLVGVAETVDGLVRDHASIPRAITQIRLKPMLLKELTEILFNAEKKLGIIFEQAAGERIAFMSQGRPHYTHLVGQLAVRAACDRASGVVRMADVTKGFEQAVKATDHMISKLYDDATYSSHKDALWKQVLLACAISAVTESDQNGYFTPVAVVAPLSAILKRTIEISTFNGHLADFCETKRGVLQRTGYPRAYRYRFCDPLVPPYVLMRGVSEGTITPDTLAEVMNSRGAFSIGPEPPS